MNRQRPMPRTLALSAAALAACYLAAGTLAPAKAQTPPAKSALPPAASAPALPVPPITVEPEPGQRAAASGGLGQAAAHAGPTSPARGNVGRYDFGAVNVLDTPQVTHDFILRNDSNAPLIVSRLQTSCSCTTAAVEPMDARKAAPSASPPPAGAAIPAEAATSPGQPFRVHVAVNLAGHAAGMLYKTVLVFAQGHRQPVAVLEMQGQLQSAASFSPPLLDFGKAAAVAFVPQTITATVDARLLPSGQMPALVASNPAIKITPAAEVAEPAASTRKSISRTYQVTVAPDAPLGPLTATLSFAQPPAATAAGIAAVNSSPLSPSVASAMAIGQVMGDVSASPAAVSFGNVPAQAAQERSVQLTGISVHALTGLKAESGSPWLSARISGGGAGAESTGGPLFRTLTLSLSPEAPKGLLQALVTIHLASGQRLLLPVTAYVMAARPGAAPHIILSNPADSAPALTRK